MAQNKTGNENENQNENMILNDTQLNVKPKEATKTKVVSPTKVQLKTKDDTNPPPVGKKPTTPDQSDAQKEERIKKNKGAIGWNQGELMGKRRWDIILFPYDQKSDHIILFSNKAPSGLKIVTGAGSAFATAQRLYGRAPSKDILVSGLGFEQMTVSPTGGRGGISLHYSPITPPLRAKLTDHKALPADHKRIDGSNAVFPLRRRQ
jgi:hypothetical protein